MLPIFRSEPQARILSWLFLRPDAELSLSEISHSVDVPLSTVHDEVKRLETAEVLLSRPIGRVKLVRANTAHPAARALTELLMLSFGPISVVSEEFDSLGAELVLIFGSWAERFEGVEGPPPRDVDVLVVGDVKRGDMYEAADRAQSRLGLPVNPVKRTAEQWRDASDGLVRDIHASPHVRVFRRGVNDALGAGGS